MCVVSPTSPNLLFVVSMGVDVVEWMLSSSLNFPILLSRFAIGDVGGL